MIAAFILGFAAGMFWMGWVRPRLPRRARVGYVPESRYFAFAAPLIDKNHEPIWFFYIRDRRQDMTRLVFKDMYVGQAPVDDDDAVTDLRVKAEDICMRLNAGVM